MDFHIVSAGFGARLGFCLGYWWVELSGVDGVFGCVGGAVVVGGYVNV